MTFEVLMAVMNQADFQVVDDSNLHCKTLIINQSNEEGTISRGEDVRMIITKERGLSRSRNTALENAEGDVCLISDDDEFFADGLEEKVLSSYDKLPDADLILFGADFKSDLYDETKRVKKLDLLKISSVQISFKRKSILDNGLRFDTKLGAGTGNGAGEETKFLLDCHKKKLKIYYCPIKLFTMRESESSWFSGYDEKFFYNRGMVTRYILGWGYSFLYAFYYVLRHKGEFSTDISPRRALKSILKGIRENRLNGNT